MANICDGAFRTLLNDCWKRTGTAGVIGAFDKRTIIELLAM